LVENIFEGGTSTAFCFGQTNAGKTFTLFGEGGGLNFQELNGDQGNVEAARGGLYLLAAYDIFKAVERLKEAEFSKPGGGEDIVVKLSMYEIKGQKLHDLLNGKEELKALEDERGVLQLVGLEQRECADLDEFLEVSNIGRTARTTAATGANSTSSRSHCAMLIRVFKGETLLGKLSLIDLAGSERGADNDNTDKLTRMEGRQINTSLLALKEVIRAMQSGGHAPFRQSRLTQVLEESLTGEQCKTVVIACVSGADVNVQHTINTLRYAAELRTNKSGMPAEVNRTKSSMMKVKAEQRGDNNNRGRARSVDTVGPTIKRTQSSGGSGPAVRSGKQKGLKAIREATSRGSNGAGVSSSTTPRGVNGRSSKSPKSTSSKPYRNASADDVGKRKNGKNKSKK
jgi:kinesin family member 2/24